MSKILHLTLKKKWFDMIASGEKKEEYREITPYWKRRLEETYYETESDCLVDAFKKFNCIRFVNGYSVNSPSILVEFKNISIDYGKVKWGAEYATKYYCIHLGNILK